MSAPGPGQNTSLGVSLSEHFLLPRTASKIFQGRSKDLAVLQRAYDDAAGSTHEKRFVVFGVGGAGKTEFCCKFAIENRDRFWGVFYIDAATDASEKAGFAEISKVANVDNNIRAIKHWLSSQQLPWLLLIENFYSDIERPIDRFFSDEANNGLILITTRDRSLRRQGNLGPGSVEINALDDEAAMQLLLTSAGLPSLAVLDTREARKLCIAVGHLPLALVTAGRAILRQQCTLETCLHFYQRCMTRVQAVATRHDSQDGMNTFQDAAFATFEMSSPITSPDSMELLRLLSFMHLQNFPIEILTQAVLNLQAGPPAPQAAPEVQPVSSSPLATLGNHAREAIFRIFNVLSSISEKPVSAKLMSRVSTQSRDNVELELRKPFVELEECALLYRTKETDSYSMHPLHHWWVRESLPLSEQAIWCTIARDILANAILMPAAGQTGEHAQLYRRALPHIAQVRTQEHEIHMKYQIQLRSRDRMWSVLQARHSRSDIQRFAKFARVYAENGQWKDATELLLLVVDFLTSNLPAGHTLITKARLFLGETYFWSAQEDKAMELQQQVLDTCLAHNGPDHPDTLAVLDKMGMSLWMKGRFLEARDRSFEAVRGFRKIYPKGSMALYQATSNLGRVIGKLARFDEAIDLHEEAVAGIRRLAKLGQVTTELLDAQENLATAYYDRYCYICKSESELAMAHELEFEVYTTRQQTLGREHPFTLWAAANIARIKAVQGDGPEAERILRDAVQIAERNLGADNFGTLFGKVHLSHVLVLNGKVPEAELLLTGVVAEHERQRRSHPDQLVAIAYLLNCYNILGKRKEAKQLHPRVIRGVRQCFGLNSWWEMYFTVKYINHDVRDVRLGAQRAAPKPPPRASISPVEPKHHLLETSSG